MDASELAQTIAKSLRTTGRVGASPSLNLKPGSPLVREWRGRTHTVTVTEDGFEYAGTFQTVAQERTNRKAIANQLTIMF